MEKSSRRELSGTVELEESEMRSSKRERGGLGFI